MRYQFYREHKYVSAALNDLERLIARMDFCDRECVKLVEENFEALSSMLHGHAEYENERLHALLKKKSVPLTVYEHIEEDHALQDQQLSEMRTSLRQISEETNREKRIEQGYHFYLMFRKFVADNLAHLHEEETKILPELQKHYSDSELQQVERPSYEQMSAEEISGMIKVLFPHMNIHDKKAFFEDIRVLAPEKFDLISKTVEQERDSIPN